MGTVKGRSKRDEWQPRMGGGGAKWRLKGGGGEKRLKRGGKDTPGEGEEKAREK